MSLYTAAAALIGGLNPPVQTAKLRLSAGTTVSGSGKQTPSYATPVQFTAAIASDGTMAVSAVTQGTLALGQTVSGTGVAPGTKIVGLESGSGGIGTYATEPVGQTVGSETMTADLVLFAQVQALTYRDLMQLDGININGDAHAIYLSAEAQGVVRPTQQGGDLIVMPDNSIWLTVQRLESWPNMIAPMWSKVAAVRQNS